MRNQIISDNTFVGRLNYPMTPHVRLLTGWFGLFGRSVYHNLPKGREVFVNIMS